MAAFNYQDLNLRFDRPFLVFKNEEFFEEEEETIETGGTAKLFKLDYLRLKYYLDYTLLLYPL
jgi:hypothetical protein